MRLKVPDPHNEANRVARSCEWVARKNTDERCALDGVSNTCPKTCGTCVTCVDSTLRFKFVYNDVYIARSCEWVTRKNTSERCAISGMAGTCRETCEFCSIAGNRKWLPLGSDIDGERETELGSSVSLSNDGNIVAIAHLRIGLVQVYSYDGIQSEWIIMGDDLGSEGNIFGNAVSLADDGKTLAVGSPGNDSGGDNSGRVIIYRYDDDLNSWIQVGSDIVGENPGDFSGESLSLSNDGKTVAIGAAGNDGNGDNSGHVRVYSYENIGLEWVQMADDIDGENFGDC